MSSAPDAGRQLPYTVRFEWGLGGRFARAQGALLAGQRGGDGPSLSSASLRRTPELGRVVLPSPNGSAISHALAGLVPPVPPSRSSRTARSRARNRRHSGRQPLGRR
ncbi:hypothetical protein [Arthrobacter sp. UYCu712]|uniref:hypothetical protein n=1 Tax=Arthrobacter sp. UYCu712 TaxID=3156340 RepID=UPI0033941289